MFLRGVRSIFAGLACLAALLLTSRGNAQSLPFPAWGSAPKPTVPISLSVRGSPGWFRIGVPAGWQINADRFSGRIAVAGEGRSVRVWLVLLSQAIDAADLVPLFSVMNAQMSPKAAWSPATLTRNGTRMSVAALGRDGDLTRVAGLSVVPAGKVTVALYATASARHAAFDANRDLFAAILESFMPLPGYVGGQPGLQGIVFERWTDPHERAFSLDTPKGWKVQGGTVRKLAIDVRQAVQVASPDQTVLIQFGDDQVPTSMEPAGSTAEQMSRGGVAPMSYLPAAEFGLRYLDWWAKPLVRDVTVDRARSLSALTQRLQAIQNAYRTVGTGRHIDAADFLFHGVWNGKLGKGYLFAAIHRIELQNSGTLWFTGDLGSLQGFVATEDRISTAVALMERMRTSFELNPQWYRDNTRTIEMMARQADETHRHVGSAVAEAYARGQPPDMSIYQRLAYYKKDVVPFNDPNSGRTYQGQVGSNYYWIAERGRIVGTATSFNPDPLWFREMLLVKP